MPIAVYLGIGIVIVYRQEKRHNTAYQRYQRKHFSQLDTLPYHTYIVAYIVERKEACPDHGAEVYSAQQTSNGRGAVSYSQYRSYIRDDTKKRYN